MLRRLKYSWPLSFVLLISLAFSARALPVSGTGGNRGTFEGTLDVRPGDGGGQAVLTLKLTNVASPEDDTIITGWYLNNPGGRIASVTMADSVFGLLGGPVFRNSIDAQPAGYFDIGAAVGESPVNTGENADRAGIGAADAGERSAGAADAGERSAAAADAGERSAGAADAGERSAGAEDGDSDDAAGPAGIAAGRTRRFQLILRGADLQGLDADSFVAERPEGGECFLAVRFQGSAADEGEIVPARMDFQPETVVTAAAGSSIPRGYALLPNYPNPFNASTNIGFQLPSGGHVSLTIYDVLGRTVRRLVDRRQEAGDYIARWNSRNDQGQVMKSGVYFCVFESGSCRETIKMVLSR